MYSDDVKSVKCFKSENPYYKIMLRYVGDYETALADHQFDKNDIWVTIIQKDEYMPDIHVNLLPDRPEIFLTDNSMNLGIIRECEIDLQMQRLKQAQVTIQEIKDLFHEHFPNI